jgi:PAS domain S-box-containing protein
MDTEEGRRTVTTGETLAVFESAADRGEPLTASEVAAQLDCARRTAYNKLRRLSDDGALRTKKVGARGRVFWLPPEDGTVPASDGESEFWRELLEESPVPLMLWDAAAGTLLEANRLARERLGIASANAVSDYRLGDIDVYDEEGNFLPVDERPYAQVLASGEAVHDAVTRVEAPGSDPRWILSNLVPLTGESGDVERVVVTSEDVTDLKRRERALAESEARFRAFAEHVDEGVWMTDGRGREIQYVNPAWERIHGQSAERLYADPNALFETIHPDDRGRVMEAIEDLRAREGAAERPLSYRVVRPAGETRHVQTVSFPVFDESGDVLWFAGLVRDRTDAVRRRTELARQRDELDRLNRVNEVIRRTQRAVVTAETRPAVERAICDELVASDPYHAALVGEFSTGRERFSVRHVAGDDTGLFRAAFEDPGMLERSPCPTTAAVETGDVQVVRDDGRDDEWAAASAAVGVGAYAAVPIAYHGVTYGVLNLFAGGPDAFDDLEVDILSELGDTVGHAISAIQRREALASDSVVELEFHSEDLAAPYLGVEGDVSFTVDRTLIGDDGTSELYFTVSGTTPAEFESVVDQFYEQASCRLLDETDGTFRMAVRTDQETLTTRLSRYGSSVRETRVEDGTLVVDVLTPEGTDVRQIRDLVEGLYPSMTLSSQRHVSSSRSDPVEVAAWLNDHLTGRQRRAVEAAYFGGYFEWPRLTTGAELAAETGVSSPTFHRHLRTGLQRLLGRVLTDVRTEDPPDETD